MARDTDRRHQCSRKGPGADDRPERVAPVHSLRSADRLPDAQAARSPTGQPALSVRAQPGVTTSMARGSPRWRAAKLRVNVFSAALLAR